MKLNFFKSKNQKDQNPGRYFIIDIQLITNQTLKSKKNVQPVIIIPGLKHVIHQTTPITDISENEYKSSFRLDTQHYS